MAWNAFVQDFKEFVSDPNLHSILKHCIGENGNSCMASHACPDLSKQPLAIYDLPECTTCIFSNSCANYLPKMKDMGCILGAFRAIAENGIVMESSQATQLLVNLVNRCRGTNIQPNHIDPHSAKQVAQQMVNLAEKMTSSSSPSSPPPQPSPPPPPLPPQSPPPPLPPQSSQPSSSSSNWFDAKNIALLVGGGVLFIIIVILVIFFLTKRKGGLRSRGAQLNSPT